MNNKYLSEETIFNQIREFIASKRGIKSSKISVNSKLYHDLGLDGDDALEFFESFSCIFCVDISEFYLDNHFGSEYSAPIRLILRKLPFIKRYIKEYEPITVADLINAVKSKKLVYPA